MEKVENILHHHKKDDGQTDEQVQDQSSTMTGPGETEQKKSKGVFGIGVGNPIPHVCLEVYRFRTQIASPGTCRGPKFAREAYTLGLASLTMIISTLLEK